MLNENLEVFQVDFAMLGTLNNIMLTENLDVFLDDFAVDATINGSTVSVIFDSEYTGFELGAEGREITALTKTSSVVGVHHGDTVAVDNKIYKVAGIHPLMDGFFTELVLSE